MSDFEMAAVALLLLLSLLFVHSACSVFIL
jgi:hypothetical protein